MDLPCLSSLVYSTAVGCSRAGFGCVSPGEPEEGEPTAPKDQVLQVTSSAWTCGWFSRLASRLGVLSALHCFVQLFGYGQHHAVYNCGHLFDTSCFEFKFPALGKSRVSIRYSNNTEHSFYYLDYFLIPVKSRHICSSISK